MTIRGKWKIAEATLGGKPLPSSSFKKMILELDENSYQLIEGKVIDSGIIEPVDNSSPFAMDIIGVFGPNKGKTFQCIYRFDGEDMIMCYNLGGDGYPKNFESPENSLLYLVHYKRVDR
ncbi:MAG TPA: TIGR03067 domain-containing protein [Puia sp.]|nr:TIGR03067 domain-containing protein [Puia sp.]